MKKLLSILTIGVLAFASNYANLQISNSTLGIYAQGKITNNEIYARGFFLYNDKKDKNNFYSIGLKGEGNLIGINIPNIKVSLLLDLVHTKNNTALPVGIGVFGYVPNIDYSVFVRGEYEYAPEILSFDDANRFSKFDIQVGIQPIENGEVFVGYRNISFNHNYNSVMYGGIGYHF
ncbi:hypothetical protein FE773_07820 [Caminibacter mediatlanticus TB-2]|uniref:Porin family protein n=1 Tax=Caminibacter mediatlanticus TB-2 TaxID=391592 RepID=A0ABX5VBT5_9BACT|nr:hypothetical protein [Caminibacter mediatlanticus]QCT95099.1 hypothetical protein FE773_07820 [Caminibacter mediatlanticus TB-2]